MTEQKQVRKNVNPLVIKGIFYVTAEFEDKQYVVSNGLSFIRFKREGEEIHKGDYLRIHGPVYQRKDAANAIITGEAVVEKMTEKEVEEHKARISLMFEDKPAPTKKAPTKKKSSAKPDIQKMPWE